MMNRLSIVSIIVIVGVISLIILTKGIFSRGDSEKMMGMIKNTSDIVSLFPKKPAELEEQIKHSIADARRRIDEIVEIPNEERTFENTAKALDTLESSSDLAIIAPVAEIITLVHPQEEMRAAGQKGIIEIEKFATAHISNNVLLYKALKAYVQGNAKNEKLSQEESYYLKERMKEFKRNGLHLSEQQLEEVKTLKNKLTELGLKFEKNVADDSSTIMVKKEELEGLSKDFINSLKQTDDGLYILGLDYPTYFMVIDHCDVSSTRKKLYRTFQNRAYPANESSLQEIIRVRDELAKKLGFSSFAELDIDSQMAKDPATVDQFLDELLEKVNVKEAQEFEMLTKHLPKSVELSSEGKLYPWDIRYVIEQYKKEHFDIDETKIAEYFPVEQTIEGLLDIYQRFLNVKFKQVSIDGLWHDDVSLVEAHDKRTDKLLGYLLFDLYPRPHKYSHACQASIIPAIKCDDSVAPSLVLIIANLPKSTPNKPSLLKRDEVETFFHEFGHAMHSLLGRTHIGSFAGTSVKTDFVEVPSQMFEEWIWDKNILKMISNHYKTGEPLPDELIDKVIAAKKLSKGHWTQRQIFLARMSLDYFKEGAHKDVDAIMRSLHNQISPHQVIDVEDHKYASFGHLVGYGAKYYSYLWSLIFAIDLFAEIKKHGLLNSDIGKRFIKDVLAPGGSKDPHDLLVEFLGREPSKENFFKDMGLSS